MDDQVLLGVAQVVGMALLPLAIVTVFMHARGLLRRGLALGRRVGLVAPLAQHPDTPPLEELAATLRRLHPAVRSPRAGTDTVRHQGILAAYDGVLVTAAQALDIPTMLTDLPEGLDQEAERLRVEHQLGRAGLCWQATESGRPPQADAE